MFIFLPGDSLKHIVFDLLSVMMILVILKSIISLAIAFGARLSPFHPAVKSLRSVVNPLVNPIRRALPPPYRTYNLDFAPMLALILLEVVRSLLI